MNPMSWQSAVDIDGLFFDRSGAAFRSRPPEAVADFRIGREICLICNSWYWG